MPTGRHLPRLHDEEGAKGGALDAEVRVAELVADAQAEAAVVCAHQVDELGVLAAQAELVSLAGIGGLVVHVLALLAWWSFVWFVVRPAGRVSRADWRR